MVNKLIQRLGFIVILIFSKIVFASDLVVNFDATMIQSPCVPQDLTYTVDFGTLMSTTFTTPPYRTPDESLIFKFNCPSGINRIVLTFDAPLKGGGSNTQLFNQIPEGVKGISALVGDPYNVYHLHFGLNDAGGVQTIEVPAGGGVVETGSYEPYLSKNGEEDFSIGNGTFLATFTVAVSYD